MTKFIKVPFADKDKVKELGGKWDKEMRSWYIPDGIDDKSLKSLSKWEEHDPLKTNENKANQMDPNAKKVYLAVPFEDKDMVKSAGGRWDGERRQWYYFAGGDESSFAKWKTDVVNDIGGSVKSNGKSGKSGKPSNNFGNKSDNSGMSGMSGNDDISDLDDILNCS